MANEYWVKRTAITQNKLTGKNIADAEKQLAKYYRKTSEKIVGQFEKVYQELLSSVSEGEKPSPSNLYKLKKYWDMQAQLMNELQALGDTQLVLFNRKFVHQFQDVYESIQLKGEQTFNKIDKEMANQMVNQVWCADGQSWSQRVWKNTSKLQIALNDKLIECLVTGRNPEDMKKYLMREFDVAFHRADTIVRTEMAHISTQASQKRYEDYGITEVQVLVDKDERTCPICGKLEGKRFPIYGKMPVPVHPNCRCCIIPVID